MGGKSSKTPESSNKRMSRYDLMQELALRAANLNRDVSVFINGSKSHSQYKNLYQALLKADKDAHNIKHGTIRRQTRNQCETLQKEIRYSIANLERKTQLDLGTEESNSFISQNFNRKRSGRQSNSNRTRMEDALDRLDGECDKLERSVRNAITLDDVPELDSLEKKIEKIYTNLEMLKLDPRDVDIKQSISKRLIKCNGKIRKYKKHHRESVPPDEIAPIEEALNKLEKTVINFEDTKEDQSYKQLQQIVESHWTKLYSIDAIGEDERARKCQAIEKAKLHLQQLEMNAHRNMQQQKAMEKLDKLHNTLERVKTKVDQQNSALDQLKSVENQLQEVEEPTGSVRSAKTNILSKIYQLYSNLEGHTNRASFEFHEIDDSQDLTHQISDLYNRWSIINANLNGLSPQIVGMLREITQGINQKLIQQEESSPDFHEKENLKELKSEAQSVLNQLDSDLNHEDLLKLEEKLNDYYDIFKKNVSIEQNSKMLDLISEGLSIIKLKKDKEKLVEIEASLEYCQELLNDGYGENFSKIQETLHECAKLLYTVGVMEEKEQLKNRIELLQKELTTKKHLKDKEELKSIIQDTQRLKEDVNRFTGPHDVFQYKQIATKLTQYLSKLNQPHFADDPNLSEARAQTESNIMKIYKILQDKSMKSDFNNSHTQINVLRDKLVEAKRRTEHFSGTYRDPLYRDIEENILQCRKDLMAIADNGHRSILLSKEQYINYIDQLFEYFEEKAKLGATTQEDPIVVLDTTTNLLDDISEKMQSDVTGKQKIIADSLRICLSNLNSLGNINVALIQRRRNELLKRVELIQNEFGDKLRSGKSEDFIRQLDNIDKLSQHLEETFEQIRSFRGDRTSKEFAELDETLIHSLIKLETIAKSGDEEIKSAKQQLEKRIQTHLRLVDTNLT